MSVYGYARVSTPDQAMPDRSSLDDQIQIIGHAAGMRRERIAQMFSDPGVSGSIQLKARPAGSRMLEILKPGDIVIVAKMDRIFRSTSDALATVDKFRENGVGLILCDMGSEPVTENGVGRLFLTIMAAVAEFERNRIHERTMDGRRAKGAKGGLMGGTPPYGYMVRGKGRNAILEVNDAEQLVVQIVKEYAATGMKISRIAKEINGIGYRSRSGKPFVGVQLERILKS